MSGATRRERYAACGGVGDFWIIECRDANGRLDLSGPQPEEYFGMGAISGMDSGQMAKAVWCHEPNAVLDGARVSEWPAVVDSRFCARQKAW